MPGGAPGDLQGNTDLPYLTAASAGTAVVTSMAGIESLTDHLLHGDLDSMASPSITTPHGRGRRRPLAVS